MKRFLFAAGLLASVAVAEADAGYMVVRVILARDAGGGPASPAGPGGDPGLPGGAMPADGPARPPAAVRGGGSGEPPQSVFAIIPFTKVPDPKGRPFYKDQERTPHWKLYVDHQYGYTNLLDDNVTLQVYDTFVRTPALSRTYQSDAANRHAVWLKNPADGQQLLDVLTDALEAGAVDEAGKCADDLFNAATAKDTKTAVTPQVGRFVKAYTEVKSAVAVGGRINDPGDGPTWRVRFGSLLTSPVEHPSAHYHLIASNDTPPAECQRRLAQLESNFKAFYLWHAARGVAVPVPDRRLAVYLASTPQEVRKLADVLDAPARVTDGFYAPDHDLLVLSPRRLDEIGLNFFTQVNDIYSKGVRRDQLLGKEPGPQVSTKAGQTKSAKDAVLPTDMARWMTWAAADRFSQEATEMATVSREGTLQLRYATGHFPRHVALPEWLTNGSAEFSHRPTGPFYTTRGDKTVVTLSLTNGYGGPNFMSFKQFRELTEKKQLNRDPGLVLRNVVADVYFAAVRAEIDADDPKLPPPFKKKAATGTAVATAPMPMPPPVMADPMPMTGMPVTGSPTGPPPVTGPAEDPASYARRKREFLTNKARATAWALYYYLIKHRPDGLERFQAELKKLPRDLPLDTDTRVAAFARAFDLTADAAGTEDRAKFAAFATEWLQTMGKIPPVGVEMELTEPAPVAKPPAPASGMPPGGSPAGAMP